MLKMMRHHAKYFYVLFFIVILSFIFWGVGTVDQSDQSTVAAEVDTYKITAEEYWRAYDRTFSFYKDLYKERFDEDMQKKLKIKESVLNNLIQNRVILVAAARNGISVSDEELSEAIKNESAFMKNGSFDNEIYQNRLRLSRLTPEAYESAKREELVIQKTRRLIELTARIDDAELSKMAPDEKLLKFLRESMMTQAKEKAVKSYVEGLKKDMKIKVYQDRIS